MEDVVIVEAVRTPIGKRNGALAPLHAADLLAVPLREVVARHGIAAGEVEQIVGGCVSQVGMQGFNVTRTAALIAGLPVEAAATTVDSQCGSSQQATSLAAALISSGQVDIAISCGVESMSRVPMGASLGQNVGKSITRSYRQRFDYTTQYQAAELIATKWGIDRQAADEYGLLSQQRAQRAWDEGRFDAQVVAVDVPDLDDEGKPLESTHEVAVDGCLRETSLDALAALQPVVDADSVHTAGTSSQIADGAAALLLMSARRARDLGLRARARIVDSCLVGCDPVLMLTGPIPATQRLFGRNGVTISDVDVVEINEAFASVVLAWEREFAPDREAVNPNGGAIALGHPLGSTGCMLLTKALNELERTDGELALVTMCCGGGLGTGTLLARS